MSDFQKEQEDLEKATKIKMQEAYEQHIEKVLDIIKKKIDIYVDYRLELGKKRLERLRKE